MKLEDMLTGPVVDLVRTHKEEQMGVENINEHPDYYPHVEWRNLCSVNEKVGELVVAYQLELDEAQKCVTTNLLRLLNGT
jgi:hypothetical protein